MRTIFDEALGGRDMRVLDELEIKQILEGSRDGIIDAATKKNA